jgi:RNA polymerase sigma-70 factor (ECF subfamily)
MALSSSHDFVALLQQAQAGQNEAWGTLLEQYRAYLTLLAEIHLDKRLQGKVSPADVVQDTFLRALRFGRKFSGTTEADLVRWLRKILASHLEEQVRRFTTQSRDISLERELGRGLDQSSEILSKKLAGFSDSPGKQASRREMGVIVINALGQLPEHYHLALKLRHLENLPTREILDRTGWTADQLDKYVRRGMIKLARILGDLT